MAHELPQLPYATDSLAPAISPETFEYHYGKHHAAYVKKLNAALEGNPLAGASLEELIARIDEIPAAKRQGTFNNAAQHFNHSFYWKSMRPGGSDGPSPALAKAIEAKFGDMDSFKTAFLNECATHFGSGWGWLIKSGDGVDVVSTHDADTPIAHGQTPLLTCDVWEHAYYIDYRNNRGGYLENFWGLVDWDFASANFEG